MARRRGAAFLAVALAALACGEEQRRLLPGAGPEDGSLPGSGASINGGSQGGSGGAPAVGAGGAALGCPPASPGGAGGSCSAVPHKAETPPLSLYLMIDRSGSMGELAGLPGASGAAGAPTTKWAALQGALDQFLENPPVKQLSVGAQFFPLPGAECAPDAYAVPLVPLVSAATARGQIVSAMSGRTPEGSTPTGAALDGALREARSWAKQQPKATAAVVLATDGVPSQCSTQDAAGLAQLALEGATASAGQPGVATFVIGILGASDLQAGALGVLNAVAKGGGTDAATLVDPSQDLAGQMASALRAAASRSVGCSFELPDTVVTHDDLALVNVTLASAGCGTRRLDYTPGGKACQGDGWAYDLDPATSGAMPSKVQLCATSCERYRQGALVTIEVGCATQGWPSK